jgi:hypothetical protein
MPPSASVKRGIRYVVGFVGHDGRADSSPFISGGRFGVGRVAAADDTMRPQDSMERNRLITGIRTCSAKAATAL